MTIEEKDEMRKRFALYGEIWLVCDDLFKETFQIGQEGFMDYQISTEEIAEAIDYERFDVRDDMDDVSPFCGIGFKEGMLMVYYGNSECPCVCIQSDSLQMILDVLTKFKEG